MIFTDLTMPGTNGIDFIKSAFSVDATLPVGHYLRALLYREPAKFMAEERNKINLHPVIGGNIIRPLRFFPKERELILHHHERFNGDGYTAGLAGTTTPVTARILAVADAYDAMTSSRLYRKARLHEHAAA